MEEKIKERKTEPQARKETPIFFRYLLKRGIKIVEIAGKIGISQKISSNLIL